MLVEDGSGRLFGAHDLGPHAEEVINLVALAMRTGVAAATLKDTIFACPTSASDLEYML